MDQAFTDHEKTVTLPNDFNPLLPNTFDPAVWGPYYWFFLHTVAHTYPEHPNAVTKRKYYDLIQNLPLFIPNPEIGNQFSVFLDKYPITPYLDSRDSFIRWVHFIHNQINLSLGKPELTLFEGMDRYFAHYRPRQILISEQYHIRKEYIIACFTVLLLFLIFFFYTK